MKFVPSSSAMVRFEHATEFARGIFDEHLYLGPVWCGSTSGSADSSCRSCTKRMLHQWFQGVRFVRARVLF